MSLSIEALRIDGYLLAAGTLKDDGTYFRCVYLGPGAPEDAAASVAEAFGLRLGSVAVGPDGATLDSTGLPVELSDWILKRFRSMDGPPIDPRLVSGLAEELADIFPPAPKWFYVKRIEPIRPELHLGAIWSVYVLGSDAGSLAIHCSWDS